MLKSGMCNVFGPYNMLEIVFSLPQVGNLLKLESYEDDHLKAHRQFPKRTFHHQ